MYNVHVGIPRASTCWNIPTNRRGIPLLDLINLYDVSVLDFIIQLYYNIK